MARSVYADRLEFPISAAPWLRRYLIILTALILFATWLIPVGWPAHIVATLLLGVAFTCLLRRIDRQKNAILVVDGAQWRIRLGEQQFDAELQTPCYSSPGLVILTLTTFGRNKSECLIIPRCSLAADQHRRLRVLLNHPRN